MLARFAAALAALALISCAQTPVPPTGSDASDDPDLERTLRWARYFVDAGLHGPLGLTREALDATSPASPAEIRRLRPVIASQKGAAEACLPVFNARTERGEPARAPGVAWAALTVSADGRPRDVVVRLDSSVPHPEAERCAAEAISRWSLPTGARGGRLWVPLTGRGPEEEPPKTEATDAFGGAFTRPRPAYPKCLPDLMGADPRIRWLVADVVVKFAVGSDGTASRIRIVSPEDLPLQAAAAIAGAVASCEYVPGTDREGKPVKIWMVLPLRFRSG